jgi:ribonuclease D
VNDSIQYITDRSRLEAVCRDLRDVPHMALDTEFVGEHTFIPALELIQIATTEMAAIIDVPGVGALEPLAELLNSPKIEKVVHAGRQDLEILAGRCGQPPRPIFDTQVAAAMVGYGTQIAYSQLVQRIVGRKLSKSHTLTNWSHRPLTSDQLTYAAEDVLFLLPVRDHLYSQLQRLGRLEWAQQEFAWLSSRLDGRDPDAPERYQRIKGWSNLHPRSAAVLRELVTWREREAASRNVPRGRVLRDQPLLELARQTPRTIADLKMIRALSSSELERSGESVLAVIRQGLALPPSAWPKIERPPRIDNEAAGQIDLLQAVLKACAEEAEIAPTLLATAADLQALVATRQQHRDRTPAVQLPILEGWRRKLAGEKLLQVLDGKMLVRIDPKTGKVRLIPNSSATS